MSIFYALTGHTGFVGSNLLNYLKSTDCVVELLNLRNEDFSLNCNVDAVVHLAGKAHDLKGLSGDEEYFQVNVELTKKLFQVFMASSAKKFIYVSSVKAMADSVIGEILRETDQHNPVTLYGASKLAAEQYLQAQFLPEGKSLYILRPCMIHGPGNKGNLNLLFQFVSKGVPWPLGAFKNKRSFLSVENFCFVVDQILSGNLLPGVYNLADSESVSTNEIIRLIAKETNRRPLMLSVPKPMVFLFAKLGDILKMPFNTERLKKLTDNYLVSNQKLLDALGRPLPVSAYNGLKKTIKSFK